MDFTIGVKPLFHSQMGCNASLVDDVPVRKKKKPTAKKEAPKPRPAQKHTDKAHMVELSDYDYTYTYTDSDDGAV